MVARSHPQTSQDLSSRVAKLEIVVETLEANC